MKAKHAVFILIALVVTAVNAYVAANGVLALVLEGDAREKASWAAFSCCSSTPPAGGLGGKPSVPAASGPSLGASSMVVFLTAYPLRRRRVQTMSGNYREYSARQAVSGPRRQARRKRRGGEYPAALRRSRR
jgi:hypothetical protein